MTARYKAPEYLVTGAAGFLGTYMVELLLEQGKTVRATDLIVPRWYPELKEIYKDSLELVMGDLTCADSLDAAVRGTSKAFHSGALFDHSKLLDILMKVNAEGTENFFERAVKYDLERVVHFGSMSAYGHEQVASLGEKFAITEEKIPSPEDNYALSKQKSREIAASYNGRNGMSVFILDPAGIFGPRSVYGNFKIIEMLKNGGMFLPDGGKHRSSSIHARDVVGIGAHLMDSNLVPLPSEKDPQKLSYLAADTTPMTGKELMEAIWREMPKNVINWPLKHLTKFLTGTIPSLRSSYMKPLLKKLKKYDALYGFGDHSASPNKILNTGYEFKFPTTKDSIHDTIEWHKREGIFRK